MAGGRQRSRWRLAAVLAVPACALLAVAASGGVPRPGAHYAGASSQGGTVRFSIARHEARLRRFRIRREFRCRRGTLRSSLTGTLRLARTPIRLDGSQFHAHHVRIQGVTGSTIRRGLVCLVGRFSRRARVARGRFRERARLRDGSRCVTGLVRFKARLRRGG
ncbi:MAG: hypothetical protein ABR581_02865 [Thermoleophilaceae bacterium]